MRAWMALAAAQLQEAKAHLTELDAAIGDADHGINISRGFAAASEKIAAETDEDLGVLCKQVGMTLMSAVGGASGMLYGNFFLRAAAVVAGKTELEDSAVVTMLQAGCEGIITRGRAEPGDKTMVDVWTPALAALDNSLHTGRDLVTSLRACVDTAEASMNATAPMQARKGRASYLGARSIGHIDPGAASSYILLRALLNAVVQTQ
jgi:dihydroxyacetone kinase-like protein